MNGDSKKIQKLSIHVAMQAVLNWKAMTKYIEFVFEDGVVRSGAQEPYDEENGGNSSSKKNNRGEDGGEDSLQMSYEPSHEIVDFQKSKVPFEIPEISTDSPLLLDQVSKTPVFVNNSSLPTFTIRLPKGGAGGEESNGNSEKNKFIELVLAEKSVSCSEYEKYRVIKTAVLGKAKNQIKDGEPIVIQKRRFNYYSNPDKPTKLVVLIYEQKGRERTYHSIMLSDQIFVIEEHKVLLSESRQTLMPYFEPVQQHFLEKSGHQVGKISTLEPKYKVIEEVTTFENYLTKKNKKIWNIVYAAYKYSHMVDLFFLSAPGVEKKEQFKTLWKKVYEESKDFNDSPNSPKTCNYIHPEAKFILKINASLRHVRFLIKENLTKTLSVVACEQDLDIIDSKWTRFDSINEMKDVYIGCQLQIQAKLAEAPIVIKPVSNPLISEPQAKKQQQGVSSNNNHHQKNDDEDFNEEDLEEEDDDVEYDAESSENYSVSNRKRGRRIGHKRINDKKVSSGAMGAHNRENKYPTRTRTKNRDESEEEDKRAAILRKTREKEALGKQSGAQVNMPFKVLNPSEVAQMKDMGAGKMGGMMNMMFPMQMPMVKKPEDGKGQPTPSGKPGMMPMMMGQMPGMGQMPAMGQMMNPMMMSMDKGQPMMMGAGMPGGMMMGGMPPGMMMMPQQPPQQQNSSNSDDKKDKKDSKEAEMPKMMMGGMDLSKMMSMGGMPMMMGGMPPGMQMGMMPQGGAGSQPPMMMMMMNPNMKDKDDKPMAMMVNPMMMNPMMMNPMMQQMGGMGGMGGMGQMGQMGQMNPQQMQQIQQQMMQMAQMGGMAQMAGMGMPQQQQSQQSQSSQQTQQGTSTESSNPNPQQMMSMMGGFPMMQGMMPGMGMGQQGQGQGSSQGQQTAQGGQPQMMGMPMVMSQEMLQQQMARMNPQQQQQFMMQMKSMGMMPFYPKPNDGKDQGKK